MDDLYILDILKALKDEPGNDAYLDRLVMEDSILWKFETSDAGSPAVVLFDLDQIGLGPLILILRNILDQLVLGLILAQNTVVLLSGELRTVATVDDLQAMIARELNSWR